MATKRRRGAMATQSPHYLGDCFALRSRNDGAYEYNSLYDTENPTQ